VTAFSAIDYDMMARALRLAKRGLYTAHPNPRVGCVILNGGEIVGEGWHRRAGEGHAEINALEQAGGAARGSTVYVSLEPCAHHGRTPPCADALVEAGVGRVVGAMQDPSREVAGKGFDRLRAAGITVESGLLETTAMALNEGFLSRVRRGRPFVRLKAAASLDGATAMQSGESQWITGAAARADVQMLRAASGAVMTGVGTVIADDPSLTVREAGIDTGGLQPLRVVLDSSLRMPTDARMLALGGETIVYCTTTDGQQAIEDAGATVVATESDGGRAALTAVLADLASRGVNDLLVEAGPALAGALLASELVDELVIYQAPHIMGSETRRLAATPSWQLLDQRLALHIVDLRMVGDDIRITARPAS
jgi:diaminohydroxyphosphoribosylaminopyrimidine deaminase/5-amino-6-(5-phosphoribosylamino)uracil reductase